MEGLPKNKTKKKTKKGELRSEETSSKDTERESEREGEEHPQEKNTNIPWVRMHFFQNKASCRIKARLAKTHMDISQHLNCRNILHVR